ncbi:MAG: hypothetical protein M0T84_12335 [Betaproteobacteria bacterium]|nr:hypothetical protein [Betaproteobacteria bacterium]
MKQRITKWSIAATSAATLAALGFSGQAHAVPSFARQTGLACSACHTVFPELTPLGRRFKLQGYTWTTKAAAAAAVNEQTGDTVLSLASIPPITLLLQASVTHWAKAPNPGTHTQNQNTYFPQQFSILSAGRVAPNLGAWLQFTYFQQTGTFGIDNSDIRYVSGLSHPNDFLWGLDVNNGPTVQDVWNTGGSIAGGTAWGIPYFPVPNAIAAPQNPMMLTILQQSVGAGAYLWYKNAFYAELQGYREAKNIATANDHNIGVGGGTLDQTAPYWRLGYEHDWGKNSWQVGTLGMYAHFTPGAAASLSQTNIYRDMGLDTQYEYIGDNNIYTVEASYMNEHQDHDSSLVGPGLTYSNSSDTLNRFEVTGSYYYQRHYGGFVSFTSETGSNDANAYCGGVVGSCNGSPKAQWETFEVDYLPYLNTKLFLQYDLYNKLDSNANAFAGAESSPSVSDNNLTVAGLWMAF